MYVQNNNMTGPLYDGCRSNDKSFRELCMYVRTYVCPCVSFLSTDGGDWIAMHVGLRSFHTIAHAT